jgi:hypothetical protein
MDAFLTLLGLVGVYLFTDHALPETEDAVAFEPHYALTLFAMLAPVTLAIFFYQPLRSLDFAKATRDLGTIQAFTGQAAKRGGQVLFISQRHLLTFGYLRGVPFVPDYEKLVLMEMAVSNNRDYLEHFYSDLDQHRFSMIIAPSLNSKDEFAGQFADEDKVWGRRVGRFLSCEYKVRVSLPKVGVDVLVPRPENPVCP